MAKRPGKSESLTIRLDPKTRFMLEFVSRLRGQTITTVVERAINDAANRATIDGQRHDYSYGGTKTVELTWRDFWSISEGERALKIAAEPDLHPSYEEERRLAFAQHFWPFFFLDRNCQIVRDEFVDILWPQIDQLIQAHDEMKPGNVNAGAELMADLLSKAQIDPPQWPPSRPRDFGQDLPDEVPF